MSDLWTCWEVRTGQDYMIQVLGTPRKSNNANPRPWKDIFKQVRYRSYTSKNSSIPEWYVSKQIVPEVNLMKTDLVGKPKKESVVLSVLCMMNEGTVEIFLVHIKQLCSQLIRMRKKNKKKKLQSSNKLQNVKKYFVHVSTFWNLLNQHVLCILKVKSNGNTCRNMFI